MPRKEKKTTIPANHYEDLAWSQNKLVIGIDEVGRGPLAGPVVASAVILPPFTNCKLIKDSKFLSETALLAAHQWITDYCSYGIGIASSAEIDRHNILNATKYAMERALATLLTGRSWTTISCITIDAVPLNTEKAPWSTLPVVSSPFGEQWSPSIAAASIVAKVYRDKIMHCLAPLFPYHLFASNKGYGTNHHFCAISKHGATIFHRSTFLEKHYARKGSESNRQQTIW